MVRRERSGSVGKVLEESLVVRSSNLDVNKKKYVRNGMVYWRDWTRVFLSGLDTWWDG